MHTPLPLMSHWENFVSWPHPLPATRLGNTILSSTPKGQRENTSLRGTRSLCHKEKPILSSGGRHDLACACGDEGGLSPKELLNGNSEEEKSNGEVEGTEL